MRHRTFRVVVITIIASALLSVGFTVGAQQANARLHPNLAAAQDFIQNAIDKLSAAQQANEFDLGGHAAKAKALLVQAYDEIGLSARTANR